MDKINILYCSACSTELASTGYDPYSKEAYYTCPNCSTDYIVTETGEHTLVIQADLNENSYKN